MSNYAEQARQRFQDLKTQNRQNFLNPAGAKSLNINMGNIEKSQEMNVKNQAIETDKQLMTAVEKGDSKQIQTLLEKGANPNQADKGDNLLINKAQSDKDFNLVINSKKFDVNHQNSAGQTALMMETNNDRNKQLLDKGADISIKDKDGDTALDYTKSNGQTSLMTPKGMGRDDSNLQQSNEQAQKANLIENHGKQKEGRSKPDFELER